MNNQTPPTLHIKQDYDFDIAAIFKRALKLSEQNYWLLLQAIIFIIGVTLVMFMIFFDAYEITSIEQYLDPATAPTPGQQIVLQLTQVFLLTPLWTGVSMVAIFYARSAIKKNQKNEESYQYKGKLSDIFWYYKLTLRLSVAALIISVATTIGINLLILPGIYIYIGATFTMPLLADKKLGPISAIVFSFKAVNMYLQKVVLLHAVFLILMILSLGLGYFWLGPLYFNMKAIIYQDLFCESAPEIEEEPAMSAEQDDGTEKGVFDA